MLPQIDETRPEEAANILCNMCGVRAVDMVEGPPDLSVAIKARNQEPLTEATNQAPASVEFATEDVQQLPVQSNGGIQL